MFQASLPWLQLALSLASLFLLYVALLWCLKWAMRMVREPVSPPPRLSIPARTDSPPRRDESGRALWRKAWHLTRLHSIYSPSGRPDCGEVAKVLVHGGATPWDAWDFAWWASEAWEAREARA